MLESDPNHPFGTIVLACRTRETSYRTQKHHVHLLLLLLRVDKQ